MAIELYWDDDEQTVMLCHFPKTWTWDEMFETLHTIKQVTDQRDYEIGAIVNVSRGITVPGGSIFSAQTREKARRMLAMSADGKGPIAIIGANGMLRTVAKGFNMLDKSAMDDVYFVDDIDEARKIMARRLDQSVSEETA
jgi:hypothetical protein